MAIRPYVRAAAVLLLSAVNAGYTLRQLLRADFDGPPLFVPIDGTAIRYAANTSSTILGFGQSFYMYRDGVWFRSSSATGPYTKIETPPAELYY